ncbi:MAG: hypothetical protein J0H81_07365 [Sphingopyxis terrae]|nr:hypothetical protein [Sphingopyxis terrae]
MSGFGHFSLALRETRIGNQEMHDRDAMSEDARQPRSPVEPRMVGFSVDDDEIDQRAVDERQLAS